MRSPSRTAVTLLLVAALATGAGCARPPESERAEVKTDGRGWLGDAVDDERTWSSSEEGAASAGGGALTAGKAVAAHDAATSSVESYAASPTGAPPTGRPATTIRLQSGAGGLRAGSTDDNERWEDYLRYRQEFLARGIPVHDLDVSERHVVRVRDRDGVPVLGARVRAYAGRADDPFADLRTYADGRALLHPKLAGVASGEALRVVVEKAGARTELDLPKDRFDHPVTIDAAPAKVTKVDVHFLLDATGSMGDEIDRLKQHVRSVAERIAGRGEAIDVRFGLTAYRDRHDAFVTRTFDLTGDVAAFDAALREVQADGGGDTPEALSAGLRSALREPSWRGDDTVKLVFLVADAAPQLDDPEQADYAVEVRAAAAAGIKIHPIASSGLDDQGEYVYRQLAQLTTGRFVFLTYGADGGPGDDTTHHVDKYAVLSLDDLVVRLVEEELGVEGGRPSGQ